MGLGGLEIILILVIALVVLSSDQLLTLGRGLLEVITGKRKLNTVDWRTVLFTIVVTASGFTIIFLERKGRLTDEQLLVAFGVLSVWALTWWFCFGIRRED
jgi:hypothetical protein